MSTKSNGTSITKRGRGRPRSTAFQSLERHLRDNAKLEKRRGKRGGSSATAIVIDDEEAPQAPPELPEPDLKRPVLDLGVPYLQRIQEQSKAFFDELVRRKAHDNNVSVGSPLADASDSSSFSLTGTTDSTSFALSLEMPPLDADAIGTTPPAVESGATEGARFDELGFEIPTPTAAADALSSARSRPFVGGIIPLITNEALPPQNGDNEDSVESGTDDSYEYAKQNIKKKLGRPPSKKPTPPVKKYTTPRDLAYARAKASLEAVEIAKANATPAVTAPPPPVVSAVGSVAFLADCTPEEAPVAFRRAMRNIFIWQLGTAIRERAGQKVLATLPVDPAVEKLFPVVPTAESMNYPERQLISKWQAMGLALVPRRISFDLEKNIKRCVYLVIKRIPKMTLLDVVADPESVNWCQMCAHRKPVIGQERPAEYMVKMGFTTRGEMVILAHTECCSRLATCHRNLHCLSYMRKAMSRLWNKEELEKGPFPDDAEPGPHARRLWDAVYNNAELFEEFCVATEEAMEEGEIRIKEVQAEGGRRDDRVGLY